MISASPVYSATSKPSAAQRLRTGNREDVRQALVDGRARTLALQADYARALPSLQVPQATALNPPLWEWGHIAWFQEFWIGRNRQRSRGTACDVTHNRAASLLNTADSLYDSSEVSHASRWHLPLPDLQATRAYLQITQAQTLDLLDALPWNASQTHSDSDLYFFRLVALHEAMHAEAAVYMAQMLGLVLEAVPARTAVSSEVLHVPAQTYVQGSRAAGFAFDNELAGHPVSLPAFEIDAAPLPWSRYLPFVESGGYQDPQWWGEAGWAWLIQTGLQAPRYLRQGHGGDWQQAVFGHVETLNPGASATHLTLHEAQAWCRWAGRRLPSEAEWECAAAAPGFLWGSAWEWTTSEFTAHPGFTAHPYRDYSQPWFGTHQVLRGASAATSQWLAHRQYRNFFQAHRNDVPAGLRSCAL